MLRRTLLAAIASLLPLSAMAQTGSAPAPAQQPTPLKVVASFSILGDFTREVGGNRVDVTTLVGANGDAHVYAPSPSDARKVAEAAVVVVNGLKFEGWIEKLIKASGTKASVVTTTTGIKTIKAAEEKDHGHSHGAVDPHAWQDAGNAKIYVANIRDALIAADPAGKDAYTTNASAYTAKLDMLDAEIKAAAQRIPVDARRIITSHDAFGYFAAAYGVTFVAPRGVSTEAEASAQDVARIIRQIKAQKARAVFVENISDPRLSERIAKETGARIGGRLYSDALSAADGPASTYIDMMRHNIKTLSTALTS
jgi:zinc/manganese transport system substrate-binding protein